MWNRVQDQNWSRMLSLKTVIISNMLTQEVGLGEVDCSGSTFDMLESEHNILIFSKS